MALADQLRHPKESTYFIIMAIVSGLIWLALIPAAIMGFAVSIPLFIILWLSSLYFKAVVYASSVKVSNEQYPEIYEKAKIFCEKLNMTTMPEIFIVNSDGVINAVAYKTLSKKYVFLYSSLVDLMLLKGHKEELDFIIGHELGHHAAGHVSLWKGILLAPAKFIPFIGAAYSRACELTADRIGHNLVNSVPASTKALASLALGSSALVQDINIDAFKRQESEIPELMGFIHKVFSSHPRTTIRVMEIQNFDEYNSFLNTKKQDTYNSPVSAPVSGAGSISAPIKVHEKIACPECHTAYEPGEKFCGNCGYKL